jgi:dipeptidyl aminopeptidase/acylaminoacyl peptidase
MAVSYARRGRWTLATIDTATGTLTNVSTGLEPLEWLTASATDAVYVAASPTTPAAVVRTNLSTGATVTLRSSSTLALDPGDISIPEAIEYPTEGGLTAHAFYYPPRNADVAAAPSDRPPLIVISHGGPTTQAKAMLDLQVQYWTSRGFAVADVNYGGSSGYGRAYRERLNARWGIVDVDDNINAAKYLVGQGRADPGRLIIRGGSAGGYTTLAALTFHPDVFKSGASYYGVSDVEALAKDTHKFESRYLDTLIGPYPEAMEVYHARSPIHFIDRLSCALILFQGLEDRIVPPDQSERMADAVRAKGLPVAYLAFEGEQHGFRKAETIVRCLEAELYFYGAVFDFTPAGPIPPIAIDNLSPNDE